MATLFEVNQIEITLNEGILSIRQEYKTPIAIPLMYVPMLLQLIEQECFPNKITRLYKEKEASDGQS